jgi:phenylacetate-coenzyme A ligase PaaK-like adenylate-forming protein
VATIRQLAPTQTKIIPWGHKISFAFVARECLQDKEQLQALAYDCVNMEQQACSSPQVIYAEVESFDELKSFAYDMAAMIGIESEKVPVIEKDVHTAAEITNVTELTRLDSLMQESLVIEGENKSWRVLVENNSELTPSPLFRTVWVKPLREERMVKELFPWRRYLQTAALLSSQERSFELGRALFKAGITRITLPGQMLESYPGEPHDGVYALRSFMQRVRMENRYLQNVMNWSDLCPHTERSDQLPLVYCSEKVMDKSDFQAHAIDKDLAQLYFKSGGSSGNPVVSLFSYEDYKTQMDVAAEGLVAAGLEPHKDLVINLFHAGGLYGGFLSFFSILESVKAKQLPMAAHTDLKMVAETIVNFGVTTVLGGPSYILNLFKENRELLKEYAGIKKVFYGGEHLNEKQRQWLQDEFQVERIKSAVYGSVDAGPLGYQCQASEGSVHHLFDRLHYLEILDPEEDKTVAAGEVGRLVFTSKHRKAGKVVRYDLGDLGRMVMEPCKCGRTSPRFELLGRIGDIFRAGGTFFNYQKFQKILKDTCDYDDLLQINIDKEEHLDRINVSLVDGNIQQKRQSLLDHYPDLKEAVDEERSILLNLTIKDKLDYLSSKQSGKVYRVFDGREQ